MGAKNSSAFVAASLVASLLITCAAPVAFADGQAPPSAPKPEPPKPEAPKPDAPKPDAPKPDAPKPEAPKPDAPKPDAPKPDAPKPEAPKDEVKISADYWPGTNQVKYRYEMRKDANGKWARNGASQAYYDNGVMEREGSYKDNQRVGKWKYYDAKGKLIRVEDRGNGKPPEPHGS